MRAAFKRARNVSNVTYDTYDLGRLKQLQQELSKHVCNLPRHAKKNM